MVRKNLATWTLCLLASTTACGGAYDESGVDFETTESGVPPAGSNAVFVSHNIPTQMAPGERLNVRVTMRNTGTAGASNDWNSTSYALHRLNSIWSWVSDPVVPTIPACGAGPCAPANESAFDFIITAPPANPNATFAAQMRLIGDQYFGQQFTLNNINVNAANARRWSCELVSSDIPASMAPSEARTVNVTVRNNGTATWPSNNICFFSRDAALGLPPANYNKWGAPSTCVPVNAPVAPNGTFTFTFPITAPATLGNHTIVRQISDLNPIGLNGGVGLFDVTAGCLNQTVNIDNMAQPTYGAAVVAQTIPSPIVAGSIATFRVTMQNTGTAAWTGSDFGLRTVNTSFAQWTTTYVPLGAAETVPPMATREFVFTVRAPSTAGVYSSQWRMIQNPGIGLFGETAVTNNINVVVGCGNRITEAGEQCDDGNLTNGDGCSSTCAIEPRSIDLATAVADRGVWGIQTGKQYSNVQIGDVTGDGMPEVIMQGGLHVYPAVGNGRSLAGEADIFAGGSAFFTGANENQPGNAPVRIYGAGINDASGGMRDSSTIIGDVTGDGIGDVIFSARTADGESNARIDAGELFVIAGAADLLSAGIIDLGATMPSPRVVAHIVGAAAGDNVLALAVADLNGDGVPDLVIGAPGRDGPAGADAGGVMVLAGPLNGEYDLSVATLISTIEGPAAGLRIGSVAGVGDINRDGRADLAVAARSYDSAGLTDRGGVWAAFGGPGIAASVTLPGGADVEWLGEGDYVGYGTSVAIGNVVGSTANEIVIGANQMRKGGVQVGGFDVWNRAFVTATTFDLSSGLSMDARVLGDNPGDEAGKSLALGDMNGDGYLDIPLIASSADGPMNDQNGNGEVRIVLGGATLTGTIDITGAPITIAMYGALARDLMGSFPRGISFGDVNGDGRSDFCIGSHQGGANGPILVPGRVDCVRSRW